MNGFLKPAIFFTLLTFSFRLGYSQYILNGSATKISCNCYTLTTPAMTLSGSVWNSNKISLYNPFDFWFNVYLGCSDAGADGIVFILQPLSTSVGTTGEGMGFGGVMPSIGIALDTYQNFNQNDPFYDHISIQANGNVNHTGDLAGPVPISATDNNVEDCQWHKLRITWDPVTEWLRAYFDGVLRVEKQVNLVGTIFNNDPNVFWGFTGATGGQVNLQQFCTALNPDFSLNLPNNGGCANSVIQFTDQSISFAPIATYSWSFGDGQTSTAAQPAPHVYAQPGNYQVSLRIKGMDGCENDTVKTVVIGSVPAAGISINDACYGRPLQVLFPSINYGVSYQWQIDGNNISTDPVPTINNLPEGSHDIDVTVTSLFQCGSPASASALFQVFPVPDIGVSFDQQCASFDFAGNQTDNKTTIGQWNWDFGDQSHSLQQNPQHQFSYGDHTVHTWAIASNGCSSDTITRNVSIVQPVAFAGNDTVVIRDHPFQLLASGNGTFQWNPGRGLSDINIANPTGVLSDDQTYTLRVTTPQGCVATDQIRIRVMLGPTVYVPSGFTPNGDGLNDILYPTYAGVPKLERFSVYNRWGQLLFSTNDVKKGWDGRAQNKPQPTGTYVWTIRGEDFLQQPVQLKGTITIIR